MLGIFFETQSFFETGSVTAIQHFTTIKAKKLQFFSYIWVDCELSLANEFTDFDIQRSLATTLYNTITRCTLSILFSQPRHMLAPDLAYCVVKSL